MGGSNVGIIYVVLHFVFAVWGYDFDPNSIPHIGTQKLKNIATSNNEEALVFFYTVYDQCPECKVLMPKYHEAVDYLNKLEEGKVVSYKCALKFPEYGVNTFPKLLLFVKDVSFLYDGDSRGEDSWTTNDILDWVEEAKQTPVQELTDETFEHLTQASTGATTGDWLVLFADRTRPECMKPHLPAIGTAALRLRMRKNVAFVDINESPNTYGRFKDVLKTNCAAMLFFHRTELYLVPSDDYSPGALLKFALEDFQYADHTDVPPEHSDAHSKLDEAMDNLKLMIESYAKAHSVHAGLLVFVLAMVIGVIFFLVKKFTKKKIL